MRETQPSPLWGRGWPATGVFISRGRTGEGVKPVKTPHPYRRTRSLARAAGQMVMSFVLLSEAVGLARWAWTPHPHDKQSVGPPARPRS